MGSTSCALHRIPAFADIDDAKRILTFDAAFSTPRVVSGMVDSSLTPEDLNQYRQRD